MKRQKNQNSQYNIERRKKKKDKGLTLSNFMACNKAMVTKTVWYRWKKRQIDQWNRKEGPEIDPHKYTRIVFKKEQRQYNGAKIVSSTNNACTTGQVHLNNDSLHISQKNNSK